MQSKIREQSSGIDLVRKKAISVMIG